mgnify:FL=1
MLCYELPSLEGYEVFLWSDFKIWVKEVIKLLSQYYYFIPPINQFPAKYTD